MDKYIMVEWPSTQGKGDTESTWRIAEQAQDDHHAKLQCYGIDVPEMIVHPLGNNRGKLQKKIKEIQSKKK